MELIGFLVKTSFVAITFLVITAPKVLLQTKMRPPRLHVWKDIHGLELNQMQNRS